MSSELADAAREATFWAAVADFAKAQATAAKLRMELVFDGSDLHIEKVRVPDVDGNELALIHTNNGRWRASVVDFPALLDWVTRRHPSEVQTVQAIRPSYMDKLFNLAIAGQGTAADPTTGEVIPGVEAVQGKPYLSVRKTHLAKERARDVLTTTATAAGYRLTQGEEHEHIPADDVDEEDIH
jgi:hypothetical protein